MSFTKRILCGLAAGVLTGLFLGERAAALKWAADGFVKLLQMTVLPYVTISIIGSLGKLRADEAKVLGKRTAWVIVGFWAIALLFALLIPLTFPHVENASFYSTTLVERRPPFNFVDLYIPSNPFHSLANNIVPAVVLFSVMVGVALIGVPRKQVLVDLLSVAAEALAAATRFIVKLTPYGLFAIAATAAGTLGVEQLGRLQVYLVAYVSVALLVALWVLPGLVAAITPIRVREMFSLTKDALLTAFVAGDLFIVLPVLIESSRTLLERHAPPDTHASALPDVIVPVSFNFPHSGKLLSVSFVLFAGWFADRAVSVADYPRLAVTGLLALFGSVNVAVPFLLDLFRIPADTFQLFLASGVINSRVGTLVAAVHTLAISLLASCAISGLLVWNRRRVVRYVAVTVVLTVAIVGGTRAVFATLLQQTYTKDKVLAGMHLLREPVPTTVRSLPEDGGVSASGDVLGAIRSRGALRVGYLPDALPFAFVNERRDVVGFDVELANRLAAELGVTLELVEIPREQLDRRVGEGACDIVMSGVAVTPERAGRLLLSASYMDETLALLVPDADREQFATWDQIRGRQQLTVAIPGVPDFEHALRSLLPNATLRPATDIRALLEARAGVDAIALPAERGSAWTLMYPDFTVVVPEPGTVKIPLGYPIARHDQAFASFVNTWIELKRKDGTLDATYRYWILGQDAAPRQPRWSIIRDVLHWVD
jgi:Na+/H+-dicarboxylate symporter/ABC-type amino acid transport substrate-binding protein